MTRYPRSSLALVFLVAAACLGPLTACRREAEGDNLLLIVVDTCRQDRMSLYGYPQATTPRIEELAAGGVVFDQSVSPVPQTLPSTASLLTSQYPASHGVRVNGLFELPSSALTLGEVLRAEGFETCAVVSAFPLDARFGLDQGFESYDCDFEGSVLTRRSGQEQVFAQARLRDFEQRADEATDKALAWLRARRNARPFFLLVHYFDPHHPYEPPEEFAALAPYDGELALADREIGRLLDALREAGLEQRTLVALVGDHGVILDPARPKAQHAGYLEEAVLRVPLVLSYPGRIAPGQRIADQVSLLDVAPTLLELLALEVPATFAGESLVPLLEGGRKREPWTMFETLFWKLEVERGVARYGLRTERYKYILTVQSREGGEERFEQLFDLQSDPLEQVNLLDHEEQAARLSELLAHFRRRTADYLALQTRSQGVELDAETERKLRQLGYLGGEDDGR